MNVNMDREGQSAEQMSRREGGRRRYKSGALAKKSEKKGENCLRLRDM